MEKKKVFVIMPFKDEFFEVYEMLKMEFIDSFEFSNAGDEGNQQNVLKDVIQPIYEADVIIADLTGLNPNVMYELGLAHSFNKKTITITQDDLSTLPFDLKQYRAKDYSTHFKKFAELIVYLKTNLNGAVDNSVSYSNPVKDFLELTGEKDVSWFSDTKDSIVLPDESDKGFLDFLADIESNTDKLTKNLNEINSDINEMTKGVEHSTSEINRVKTTGGSGTAAFVRKETKNAAKIIETFDKKLKEHNANLVSLWNEIEKNTLGLIENPYSSKSGNRESLIIYLKSLYNMKSSATSCAESVNVLRQTMRNNMGIERTMNQAIRFVDEDLSSFINFTDMLGASVEKILAKARFIVGEVDYENS